VDVAHGLSVYSPDYISHFRLQRSIHGVNGINDIYGNQKTQSEVFSGMNQLRPFIVIANKYDGPALSGDWHDYLDVTTIDAILETFEKMCPDGTAVYINNQGLEGNNHTLMDEVSGKTDTQIVKKYKSGVHLNDLVALNPGVPLNEIMGRVLSMSQCFYTVQGGIQHVVDQFGGRQMIYHTITKWGEKYTRPGGMHSGSVHSVHSTRQSLLVSMMDFMYQGDQCTCYMR
jgi:hypothetical protein